MNNKSSSWINNNQLYNNSFAILEINSTLIVLALTESSF